MQQRYEFTQFDNSAGLKQVARKRYVELNRGLSENELRTLAKILEFFPHTNLNWYTTFTTADFSCFPKDLLEIAANAVDDCGNTMLGEVSCEGGNPVAAKILLDLGANPDQRDERGKLPLHWAIGATAHRPQALEIVRLLLNAGAKTDLIYHDMPVLAYAKNNLSYLRGPNDEAPAVKLIEQVELDRKTQLLPLPSLTEPHNSLSAKPRAIMHDIFPPVVSSEALQNKSKCEDQKTISFR